MSEGTRARGRLMPAPFAMPFRGSCAAWLLVAPLVFRAPEGPAAREARRPHFVRRRASKPARALRSLRRPPHRRRLVADVWLGALTRCPAGPRRRPPAPRPGPSIPQDSHPAVTSHIPEPAPNFACNSPATISNIEFTALKLQRFQTLLRFRPVELHASFCGEWAHRCLLVSQPEPAGRVCGCLKLLSPLLVQAGSQLKPPSPLRAGEVGQLKPASPLRVRNGCFWRGFRLHW